MAVGKPTPERMNRTGVVTPRYAIDPNSETWKAVQQFLEERLHIRWANLGQPGTPIDETENCRGAIEELTHLEQLGQPNVTTGFTDEEVQTLETAAAARRVSERGGSY